MRNVFLCTLLLCLYLSCLPLCLLPFLLSIFWIGSNTLFDHAEMANLCPLSIEPPVSPCHRSSIPCLSAVQSLRRSAESAATNEMPNDNPGNRPPLPPFPDPLRNNISQRTHATSNVSPNTANATASKAAVVTRPPPLPNNLIPALPPPCPPWGLVPKRIPVHPVTTFSNGATSSTSPADRSTPLRSTLVALPGRGGRRAGHASGTGRPASEPPVEGRRWKRRPKRDRWGSRETVAGE